MYRRERDMYRQFYQIGSRICGNPVKIALALKRATEEMKRFTARVESGIHPDKAAPGGNCPGQVPRQLKRAWVAVIGHPYNVYDGFINIGLLKRLDQAGIGVLTADNVPAGVVDHHASTLNKKLFWTLGRRMVGAAYHFLEDPAISGIIHVASFACGPDSMTGEIIERRARQAGAKPYLNLTLDEHTGEAGIVTRIEAFLDMVGVHGQAAEGT
jgi:predicted nucleotide-binding protein (sugar kinase/HSP70/actin superfamily)